MQNQRLNANFEKGIKELRNLLIGCLIITALRVGLVIAYRDVVNCHVRDVNKPK